MTRFVDWLCYRIVMAWPWSWPNNLLCDEILACAGRYAFAPDDEVTP